MVKLARIIGYKRNAEFRLDQIRAGYRVAIEKNLRRVEVIEIDRPLEIRLWAVVKDLFSRKRNEVDPYRAISLYVQSLSDLRIGGIDIRIKEHRVCGLRSRLRLSLAIWGWMLGYLFFSTVIPRRFKERLDRIDNIGLLYSTSLRNQWWRGGLLDKNRLHKRSIIEWIYLNRIDLSRLLSKDVYVVSSAQEYCYLDMLIPRRLSQSGVKYLEMQTMDGICRLEEIENDHLHSFIPDKKDVPERRQKQIVESVEEHMKDRMEGRGIFYMDSSRYIDTEFSAETMRMKSCKRAETPSLGFFGACISDAEFVWGHERDYETIHEWELNCIKTLLDEECTIYFRIHPNASTVNSAESVALKRYQNIARSSEGKLVIVGSEMPIKMFMKYIDGGITHHGSVAEELLWSGLGCMSSGSVPWKNFNLSGNVRLTDYYSIKDFLDLCRDRKTHGRRSWASNDELYRYIYTYRSLDTGNTASRKYLTAGSIDIIRKIARSGLGSNDLSEELARHIEEYNAQQ